MNRTEVFEFVFERFNVTKEQMLREDRRERISKPRQITMFLLRELVDLSLPQVGRIMHRDHTTVLFGYNKIYKEIKNGDLDLGIKIDVFKIKKRTAKSFDKTLEDALMIFKVELLKTFNDDPLGALIKFSKVLNRKD